MKTRKFYYSEEVSGQQAFCEVGKIIAREYFSRYKKMELINIRFLRKVYKRLWRIMKSSYTRDQVIVYLRWAMYRHIRCLDYTLGEDAHKILIDFTCDSPYAFQRLTSRYLKLLQRVREGQI